MKQRVFCSLCYESSDFKENDLELSVGCSWKRKLKQLIRDSGIITWHVAAICFVFCPSAILKCHGGGFVCVTVCLFVCP